MKRIIVIVLCLVMFVSFVSCNTGSSDSGEAFTEDRKETDVTTEVETTTVPPLGEYVTGTQTAKSGDILSKPEIETDGSKLNNFYVKSENSQYFRGIEINIYNTMSVKGLHDDRTEFIFRQDETSSIKTDMSTSVSATAVFLFDNVNKTAKIFEAVSMNTDLSEGVTENEDIEDQMNGIISSFIGDGEFSDISDRYTYEEAHTYMKQILGMYSGIYFSEYLKTVNPPMEFKKSADEGNCVVYYSSNNGESLKFTEKQVFLNMLLIDLETSYV